MVRPGRYNVCWFLLSYGLILIREDLAGAGDTWRRSRKKAGEERVSCGKCGVRRLYIVVLIPFLWLGTGEAMVLVCVVPDGGLG